MNGPVWRCTDARNDPLGCLGATEAEANRARLRRYAQVAVRTVDDPDFVRRYLAGVKIQHRARRAGMATALAYVLTVGERVLTLGPRPEKPDVHFVVHGVEDMREQFNRVTRTWGLSAHGFDTTRYRK